MVPFVFGEVLLDESMAVRATQGNEMSGCWYGQHLG